MSEAAAEDAACNARAIKGGGVHQNLLGGRRDDETPGGGSRRGHGG